MIIVVVVIAFIFGIALVQMDSVIPNARLKQQTRATANIIELAFSQAAIEGKELSLTFDREEQMVKLEYYFENEEDKEFFLEQTQAHLLDEEKEAIEEIEPLFTRKWNSNLELSNLEVLTYEEEDTRDFIIFSPEGISDGAIITWHDSSGISQSLELWPLLGKISISKVKNDY